MECDEYHGAGTERSDDGECGGDGGWCGEQRSELHGDRASTEHHESESDVRAGGDGGDNHGHELWSDAGDEHGEVQWDGGSTDELECDEYHGAGTERSDDGECGGDGGWCGEQRSELHGDRASTEHHESESDVRAGGDGGDNHGHELWSDAGDEHGEVQWDGGSTDELECDEYHGAGTEWGHHGKRHRYRWWGGEQRSELHGDRASTEHHESESDVRAGGDGGDNHGHELWSDTGHEHGEVQRDSGTPTSWSATSITVPVPSGATTGNVVVTVGGVASNGVSFTVTAAAPVITSSDRASGTVGMAFSYQITATNSPTSFGAAGLPSGLTVNTVSGLVSGTPTGAAGTSSVTLSATNSGGTGSAPLTLTIGSGGTGSLVSHTIQISSDADDGYYNDQNGSWHSTPGSGGADLVGSWSGLTTAWVTGYRFPSVGANSGDTIQSAYLQLVSSDGSATSAICGSAPCNSNNYTFRVYGVAQDNGAAFSGRQGTLRWTCLIQRLTRITRLRDRVMTMAVAKGRTTDKTPAPTLSMSRISSGKSLRDQGGRTRLPCGL